MNSDLCIGIAANRGVLEFAAIEAGKKAVMARFPANGMGVEAIRMFLVDSGNHVRLAVAGSAAVALALSLGNVSGRETFIVSSAVADQAMALARYAAHAI